MGKEDPREGVIEESMERGFLANVAIFEVSAAVKE
jgi:hypothetical protein